MFLHVFITWLIANLLHPVMLFIGFIIIIGGNDNNIFSGESLGILILGFFYSAFFSVPCLLLGWPLLHLIVLTKNITPVKFIAWLFFMALLIVLEVWILLLLLNDGEELELLFLSLPAIAATWVAIIIRWKQFRDLVQRYETNDDNDEQVYNNQ